MKPSLVLVLLVAACGGATPPAASPSDALRSSPSSAALPAPASQVVDEAPLDDPNEREGAIDLVALVDKATSPVFPKQMVGDRECLNQLQFTGRHRADFATLISKCGTPTGMLEYVKPAQGRLHEQRDKHDEFKLRVQKGMCYRYFAVADETIKDIDIIILKQGAMLGMDKTEKPLAVIETEKLWCVDEDMDLQFNIAVDGAGAGGYTFGVWTRPSQ